MKPHLPKVIISALLAAQVAVGVTVSDTTELEWTALTITTPANGILTTGNSAIDWSEETGNLTDSWKLSFTLDPSRLGDYYLFGTKKVVSGAEGYTLTITENGTISLNENKNTSVITAGAYTADDSAVAITLQFVRCVDGIGNDAGGVFTLSVGSESTTYTVEDLTNTILTKGSDNNLWTNGGGETFSGIAVSHSGLVISDRVYFWNGASGSNWTDACWQHKEMQENGALTELTEDAYVVFASDEETEQLVNLSTGCAATRFAVQSGDWALAGGGELTIAEDFVLKDSSSLTIQEDTRLVISGAATIGSEAQLTLEKGGTLELKGGVRDDEYEYVDDVWLLSEDYTPLLQTVTGAGDIVISEDVSFVGSTDPDNPTRLQTTGNLIVQDAATFYLGAYRANPELYVDASSLSSIQLTDGSTLWYRAGESTLQKVQTSGSEPSVLHIQGLDGFHSIGDNAKLIIKELVLDADMQIEGGNNAALAVENLSGEGNLSLIGSRNTDSAHLVELSIGNSYSGTISLADKRNTEFALTLTNGASATIQGIDGNGIGQNTQLKTTLEDGTHLHVAGNSASVVKWEEFVITHGSSATLSADEGVQLNVREISGGHLSIGAEVGSVSLTGGTITNNASLSLYGNITISGELDSYESYGSGNQIGYSMNDGTANGFKIVAGKQYYLSMGGSNSLATNTAALNINTTESLTSDTAYLSVEEATEEKQAGIVFSLDPTYSAEFYVQEGRVDQSSLLADETCGVTATTHYIISGGTLSLSQNVGTNLLTYESGSVELQSGSTLSINTAAESNAALLMNSSGAGSVQVSQDIALADDYTANISGELNISQATVAQGKADLESFSGIRLSNGATLSYGNREQSYTNLTVNSGTQNLTYTAAGDETGAATLSIGKLSGSGELHLTATDKLTLSLEDTQQFEGTLLMNSNHISLNLAENAGITAWYQETAASELNLLNVGAGNTIGMRVVTGSLTSGSIAANLELQNYGSAALWISDKDENGEITLTGSISGSGNMGLAAADKSISMSITGDTSGWNGNIQFHGNEHQLTFTENAVSIRNSKIFTANGGTGNVAFRHESEATVAAALDGALHVTVSNSSEEGTRFTNSVNISSLSVEADSRVAVTHSTVSVDAVDNAGNLSFTGIQSLTLTDLSLADGSTLSVGSGVATIAAESADTFTGVTVSGTAVLEGGSTINGSLDLSEAASIELNNMDEAIDINGDLILGLGEYVTVSGNYTEMLENLVDGQSLDIFRVSGSITLNGLELTDGYSEDAGSLIAAIEQGRYSLGYRASATGDGGTLYLSTASSPAVPEPTTATLSLLALAAMAARRRRK